MKKNKLMFIATLSTACLLSLASCQGAQGPKGDQGEPGINGTNGTDGKPGENGEDGNSVRTGKGVPASTLGKDGDSYIDTETFDFYVKSNGAWSKEGNIKGASGNAGSQGEDGTSIRNGKGVPADTLGNDGDCYIDLSTFDFYVKVDGKWSKEGNIKGEQGDKGEKGDKGNTGSTGSQGADGKPGETAWANTILPCDNGYIVPSVGSAIADNKNQVTFKMYPDADKTDYKCTSLTLKSKNGDNTIYADSLLDGTDGNYRYYTTTMVEGGFVVSATFSNSQVACNITNVEGGTIKFDGVEDTSKNFLPGDYVNLIITPDTSKKLKTLIIGSKTYTLSELKEDSNFEDKNNGSYAYKFKMTNDPLTVKASYDQAYKIIKDNTYNAYAEITTNIKGDYALEGDDVTITVKVTNSDSILKAIKIDGTTVKDLSKNTAKGGEYTYEFKMPNKDITVSIEVENPGNVKIDELSGGEITASCETAYPGSKVTLTITPNSKKYLKSLSVNGTPITQTETNYIKGKAIDSNVLTFDVEMVKDGLKIDATFTDNRKEALTRVYEVNNINDLEAFRNNVNEDSLIYEGATIKLMNNIDLENKEWEPIDFYYGRVGKNNNLNESLVGFTFDGNNKTISNLKVNKVGVDNSDTGKFVGFFGHADYSEIKNLKIVNANITGINQVGVICGAMLYGKGINGCSVEKANVKADPSIKDSGGEYNGDKVGAIAGYCCPSGTTDFSNNTVKDVELSGYRDMGAVIGCFAEGNEVTLDNTTLSGYINFIVDNSIDDATNKGSKGNGIDESKFNIGDLWGRNAAATKITETNINKTEATITKKFSFKGFDHVFGTKEYNISTADGLFYFAKHAEEFKDVTINITNDIDLVGREWEPITFKVDQGLTINGNNHSIKNMTINKNTVTDYVPNDNVGFFGYVQSSNFKIQNLTFENPIVKAKGKFVGTVIGSCSGTITLDNVDIIGSQVLTEDFLKSDGANYERSIRVGGMIGRIMNEFAFNNKNHVALKNCDVDKLTINGYHNVGGMIGSCNITEKQSSGETITYSEVITENCTLSNSTITYRVNSSDENKGGFLFGANNVYTEYMPLSGFTCTNNNQVIKKP